MNRNWTEGLTENPSRCGHINQMESDHLCENWGIGVVCTCQIRQFEVRNALFEANRSFDLHVLSSSLSPACRADTTMQDVVFPANASYPPPERPANNQSSDTNTSSCLGAAGVKVGGCSVKAGQAPCGANSVLCGLLLLIGGVRVNQSGEGKANLVCVRMEWRCLPTAQHCSITAPMVSNSPPVPIGFTCRHSRDREFGWWWSLLMTWEVQHSAGGCVSPRVRHQYALLHFQQSGVGVSCDGRGGGGGEQALLRQQNGLAMACRYQVHCWPPSTSTHQTLGGPSSKTRQRAHYVLVDRDPSRDFYSYERGRGSIRAGPRVAVQCGHVGEGGESPG